MIQDGGQDTGGTRAVRGSSVSSSRSRPQPSTLHIPNIVHQYSKLVPDSEPTINLMSNTTVSQYKIPRKEQKIQQRTIRSHMQGIHISKARRQFSCSCHCHYLRVFSFILLFFKSYPETKTQYGQNQVENTVIKVIRTNSTRNVYMFNIM